MRIVNNCYIALFGYSAAVIDMFELLLHNTIIDFIWYFVHALKSSYKVDSKVERCYCWEVFKIIRLYIFINWEWFFDGRA